MYCVNLIYAILAASSPSKCTCGVRILVLTGLLFLDNTKTKKQKYTLYYFYSLNVHYMCRFVLFVYICIVVGDPVIRGRGLGCY
jgi:hypothetical protein